jgi:hypothetical protein
MALYLRRTDYGGKWAIVDELGTSTIQVIAASISVCGENGPASDTKWLVRSPTNSMVLDTSVTILDIIGLASIVADPTIVIGDNITALKWAS